MPAVSIITASTLNGGFETAGGGGADVFANWAESISAGTTTLNRDTAVFHSGAASCRSDMDSFGNSSIIQQAVLRVGQRYTVSFWAKSSGANARIRVSGPVNTIYYETGDLTASWTLYTATFVATDADFRLILFGAPSASIWIDDVTLTHDSSISVLMARCPEPGEDFWRIILQFQPRAASGSADFYLSTDGSTIAYVGDTTKGITLFDPNIRPGTIASPGPFVSAVATVRSAACPDMDPDDPFAYLLAESAPAPTINSLVRIERTYGRIPASQVEYDFSDFARPSVHDVKSGSYYGASFEPGRDWIFNSRVSVSAVGSPTASYLTNGNTRGTLPHVQITFQANNSSQTFFADDNDTTIKNAVSTAHSGGTGAANQFVIVRNADGFSVGYINGGSTVLALSSAGIEAEVELGGNIMVGVASTAGDTLFTVRAREVVVPAVRDITTSGAHSGSSGGWVAMWNGSKLVGVVKATAASGSSVTIPANEDPWNVGDLAITHLAFATQALTCILNGPKACTIRRRLDFWLPGFSMLSDGSTLSDASAIPLVSSGDNPESWIAAVGGGTDYLNIDTGRLSQQLGALLVQSGTELQMDDAIQTQTP